MSWNARRVVTAAVAGSVLLVLLVVVNAPTGAVMPVSGPGSRAARTSDGEHGAKYPIVRAIPRSPPQELDDALSDEDSDPDDSAAQPDEKNSGSAGEQHNPPQRLPVQPVPSSVGSKSPVLPALGGKEGAPDAPHPDASRLRVVPRDALASESDVTVWPLWPVESFERPNPIVFEPQFDYSRLGRHPNGPQWGWQVPSGKPKPVWDGHNVYPFGGRDAYVAVIPGGFVGREGSIYDAQRYFDLDPILSYRGGLDFEPSVAQQDGRPIRRFPLLVSAVQKWSTEFFHYTMETLPRLALVLQFLREHPDAKVLLPRAPGFTSEMQDMLGLRAGQVEPYDENVIYYAQRLVVPMPTPCAHVAREQAQLLHRLLVPAELPASERQSIVVIRRPAGKVRGLEGYEQIVRLLREQFGQQRVVEFDGGSGAARARETFQRAALVIAPHGGALGNLIWAAKGTAVLEVMQEADPNMCYWHAASALELRYAVMIAPGSSSSSSLRVDPAQLVANAATLLQRASAL